MASRLNEEDTGKPRAAAHVEVFRNKNYFLRLYGPKPATDGRIIVTFPDLIHPTGENAPGWGVGFLSKRGASVLAVTFAKATWYQSEGFFDVLDAARAFVGPDVVITAYGSSMGGYGALLAGKRLHADRVVALCPQFSIEQDVAPFELRYREQAKLIGRYNFNVKRELTDHIDYFTVFDPTHRIDRRHVALFPKTRNWHSVVLPGAAHGVLQTIIDLGAKETLFELLNGNMDARGFRTALRTGRSSSARYTRRMGNLCAAHPRLAKENALKTFIDRARALKLEKFVKRWSAVRGAQGASSPSIKRSWQGLEELILHVGLPKTGTTSIQLHFAAHRTFYLESGVSYPMGDATSLPHHGWLGKSLVSGDFSMLEETLSTATGVRVLLSDETVYNETAFASTLAKPALRELLKGIPLRLLAVTRPVESWKRSFYKQALQNRARPNAQGSAHFWGKADLYEDYFKIPEVAELADQDGMLDRISDLFGSPIETIAMRKGVDLVPEFVGALELTPVSTSPEPFANPSLTDLDAELLRQANVQGGTGHGFMALLLSLPEDQSPTKLAAMLRRGRRETIIRAQNDFDWNRIRYTENPPLQYDQAGFDAKKIFLHSRSEALFAALQEVAARDG